jgi:hypothetical protein
LCMYLRYMLLFAGSIGLSMYIPWKTEYHGKICLLEWFKVHHDLCKEMFNTDDEWFHKLSPQLIDHRKGPCQLVLEIQILTQDRHQKVAGLNWVMGSQPSPLDRYPTEIQMYTSNKITAHNHFLSKWTHSLT